MKIVFMGTPDFAVTALQALAKEHEIVCVYSQPPRPAGRGHKLMSSPVQTQAEAYGIEVRTPLSLRNEEEQQKFKALKADVAVVAAYGLILPQPILEAFPLGCINIHASLLPRWRGAAPIQRAIMAGDEKTGVTVMQMDKGMDTGAMLLKKETVVAGKNTAELTRELAQTGAAAVLEVLADMPAPMPQPEDGVTYASKIKKEEGLIDFAKSALEIERQIRALPSWFVYKGERIKILRAEALLKTEAGEQSNTNSSVGKSGDVTDDFTIVCGAGGFLNPLLLQREGRALLAKDEFLRGFTFTAGENVAL